MEGEKGAGFDFVAPQYFYSLETAALVDQDGADAYFDAETSGKDINEERSGDKTPESCSPSGVFSTPMDKLQKNVQAVEIKYETIPEEEEPIEEANELQQKELDFAEELWTKQEIKEEGAEEEKETNVKRIIKPVLKRLSLPGRKKPINIENVLQEAMASLQVKQGPGRKTFDGIELLPKTPDKVHTMVTRQDIVLNTPTFSLRSRQAVRQSLKRKGSPVGHPEHTAKYMTVAEQIMHFQKDTPPRFHTFKSGISVPPRPVQKLLKVTVPNSPALATKQRIRPSMAPTMEQRELMEVEEMKKHQVKALPLNEKILESGRTTVAKVEPKPATIPQPFHLTQIVKKTPAKEEPFTFTARPVPKSVYQGPLSRRYRVSTMKVASDGELQQEQEDMYCGINAVASKNSTITSYVSDSYTRGQEMLKKKEEKIKKILEDEKKLREFRANPLPSFLASKRNSEYSFSSTMCHNNTVNDENEHSRVFKARPATVLHKKPFEPKKSQTPLLVITDIELNTERRAKEREDFDRKIREKDEFLAIKRSEVEEARAKAEHEEVVKLRKELVHKAKPIPVFKPVNITAKVRQPTEPNSPLLLTRSRSGLHKT